MGCCACIGQRWGWQMSESRIREFYETYWHGASGDPEAAQLVKERQAKLGAALNELPTGGRVLDLGCGDGVFCDLIAKQGFVPVGADISEVGIARARAHYPKFEFRVGSLETRLPFADGEFDAVWCSEVVEHLFDVSFALGEMARVLTAGGTLILTTPYHGLVKNVVVALRNFDAHYDVQGGHIRFFTRRSLRQLLEQQGFEVTVMDGVGRGWPLWMSHWVVARKRTTNRA